MTINSVFGTNLRMLSLARGSLAKAGADLEVSRIQFQRYLKGESFPKPNELVRICSYFGVDSRILTQPLSDSLLLESRGGMASDRNDSMFQERWLTAVGYAAPAIDYFSGPHLLVDGLYMTWRVSMSQPGKIYRTPLQVKTIDDVKVIRGYDPRSLYPDGRGLASERVFRGFCLRMVWGYSIWCFQAAPALITSTIFVSPRTAIGSEISFLGFFTLSRDEAQGARRVSRILMEKVPNGCRQLIQEAHKPLYYAQEDVPARIASLIASPVV